MMTSRRTAAITLVALATASGFAFAQSAKEV